MQKQLQIEKLKEKIESLAKKYKISYAIIFGSFAEERFVEGESDIDLAIKVKDLKRAEVLNFLKNFLRELEFENVDVTILNFSPFSLQYDALLKGKVIYCKNEEELLDDRLKIIKWHEDWLHMYKIFEQREIEKVKKNESGTVKRLERFNSGIKILEEVRKARKDVFISDLKLLSLAERNIQVCVEFIVDLSNFLIGKLGLKIPENYKESIERIHEAGVIDDELKNSLIDLVGLRNIIVHMYADIKADLIFDELDEIVESLKSGVNRLLEFCKQKGIDP
jgi:uncharacterized protein YutE (UPF0331/DUF86 family)/predicted nucleotidyltransferase